MEEENLKTLGDYLDILDRRKFHLIVPFFVVAFIAIIVAMKLPAVYRSKAMILIEEQQVPKSLVPTTVTDFADQRIQLIKQRVLTREHILSIIDKYQLYTKQKQRLAPSELVQQFKDDASVDLIAADVVNPQQGQGSKATIAFTLSFNDRQPETAQAVANELVSIFLAENTRVRTERATKTTTFLRDEAEKMKRELQSLEDKVAEYKEKFGKSLPELYQINLAALDRTDAELQTTQSQTNVLNDRIAYLTGQLPLIKQQTPDSRDDKAPLSKEEQLETLKSTYTRLALRYTVSHPDVLQVERQIRTLDPDFKGTLAEQEAPRELEQAQKELETLREKYAENHPDVMKLRQKVQTLEQLSQSTSANIKQPPTETAQTKDAAYVNLIAQLKSAQMELDGLIKRRGELQQKKKELQEIIDQTPQVERGYQDLIRERQSSMEKFAELKSKTMEAKLAQTLEEEQKGESFTLIEPPLVPDKAEKPNRKKIMLMGLGAAFLSGIAAVVLAEIMNAGIRGHRALHEITGMPPLVVIPYIENQHDVERHRRQIRLISGVAIAGFVAAILLTHFLLMPLDMIWAKAFRLLQHI